MNSILDQQTAQIVTLLLSHVSSSAIIVWLIQWAKQCPKISWLTQNTPGRARAVAIVLAGIKTVGIQFSWNSETRIAAFVIPTLVTGIGLAWHWFSSFVLQEWMYHMARSATNGSIKFTNAGPTMASGMAGGQTIIGKTAP